MTLAFSAHRLQTQVIIEHSYLGPMCLQFSNPPSVVDVKSEIMEKTGLPIKDQDIYCNGKKVSHIEKMDNFWQSSSSLKGCQGEPHTHKKTLIVFSQATITDVFASCRKRY